MVGLQERMKGPRYDVYGPWARGQCARRMCLLISDDEIEWNIGRTHRGGMIC